MIDHLIVTQEAPDLSAFETEWRGPNPVTATYQGQRIDIVPVTIYRTEPTEETPAETAPGFWFAVRAATVLDLPWPTVTVTDSDLAEQGLPFVLSVGEGWTWGQLSGRVWPVWAGTDYPLGPSMGPHMLAS